MDALLTLVADRYRTDESRAVLVGLQAAARRSGWGQSVRPVFWPDGLTGVDLRGAETLALVLHETGQHTEGDALLDVWEAAAAARGGFGQVLPVIVVAPTKAGAESEWTARLSRLGNALPPVFIRTSGDVRLEHGGIASLSDDAVRTLEQRMQTANAAAHWGVARNAPDRGTIPLHVAGR